MPDVDKYGVEDVCKHYVRKYGWLPASKSQEKSIRDQRGAFKRTLIKQPLRYFTFCAAGAIDVFLLEHGGVIKRSTDTARLDGVFFCEKDANSFSQIAERIGSPDQGFLGDFSKIILFEDDEDTIGRSLYSDDSEEYDEALREKLRLKDTHERLKQSCPFDIINFDPYGMMFQSGQGALTKIFLSFLRLLEWQTEAARNPKSRCQQFTLFLTTHLDADNTDTQVISQLSSRLTDNLRSNQHFKEVFTSRFRHADAAKLASEDFPQFFCLAFPKFMIHEVLFRLGWTIEHHPMFLYEREYKSREIGKKYKMMSAVAVFKQVPDFGQSLSGPSAAQYNDLSDQLIDTPVMDVEPQLTPQTVAELKQDIEQIIALAEQNL